MALAASALATELQRLPATTRSPAPKDHRLGAGERVVVSGVGHCSSVSRALAAKAQCLGFDSRWHHFLSSPILFQRSTDSNDAGCVLSAHCQEVFERSPLPSCLSSDAVLFQWPSCVYT